MPRRPLSVTLDADNLLWLRAQAGSTRSVSRIVDELVAEARASGKNRGAGPVSVVGTVDLLNFDPVSADRELRSFFDTTSGGAVAVRETQARYDRKQRQAKR
jgi:hypothetical protein